MSDYRWWSEHDPAQCPFTACAICDRVEDDTARRALLAELARIREGGMELPDHGARDAGEEVAG